MCVVYVMCERKRLRSGIPWKKGCAFLYPASTIETYKDHGADRGECKVKTRERAPGKPTRKDNMMARI